jgi:hypothetical protein
MGTVKLAVTNRCKELLYGHYWSTSNLLATKPVVYAGKFELAGLNQAGF